MITLLEQLHSVGYIYGDLKPENIMVGEHGQNEGLELKLIDFGICRSYLRKNGTHISEGYQKGEGNLAFASPTSLQDQRLSRRDDLYSLYLVLLYLRTN